MAPNGDTVQAAHSAAAHVHPTTTLYNILIILAAGTASFLFGYTNNAIAGTLAQTSFQVKFLTENPNELINGMLGAFFGGGLLGAIGQSFLSEKLGRRWTNLIAAVFVFVSSILQASAYHIAQYMVARVINGFGGGILLSSTPVYMSEIAPAHSRGLLVSCQGIAITLSYVVSSLAAFGFQYIDASYQWRMQYVVLIGLSLILMVIMFVIPESPRWLMDRGRHDEAWIVLEKLHKSKTDPDATLARLEYIQIKAQIEEEKGMDTTWIGIFTKPSTRKRTICGALVWIMGQSTGILVIANFAPTLFGTLGYDTELQLGLGVAWVSTCAIGTWCSNLLIERLGRVKQMVIGAYVCSACLLVEAILQKYYIGTDHEAGLKAAVAMYFIFVFFFGLFVECPGYTYIVEIWPTHLRPQGATIGIVSFFAMTIALNTPAATAFATIGWRFYFVFIAVCLTSATVMLFYCPETAGLTLEEVAAQFGDHVAIKFDEIDVDQDKDHPAQRQSVTAEEKV